MKSCRQCQKQFVIEPEDTKFYESMQVPAPSMCPSCRQQQRMSFRNEISLFYRKCDKTGKTVVSMYAPDAPYVVYDHEEWWKDDWNPLSYGMEFDFSRPFFEQFAELQRKVPRMSLYVEGAENSYFTSYAIRNKNCYLIFTADYNEECQYGRFCDRNYRCMDMDYTHDSKFCYETLDVHKSNACFFSQKIDSSSDLYFCYDMRNCHNCIFSSGLRNQSFMVFNKKVTREEFERVKQNLNLGSRRGLREAKKKAHDFFKTQPRKFLETVQCEDCIGDYLKNCKNAKHCFDSYELQDVKYSSNVFRLKDCYDWDFVGNQSERCYFMASSAGRDMNCRFCMNTWEGCTDMAYCDMCLYDENCFGCVGLTHKKYCILNKQYTKEEYEALVPRIIEHMKKTPIAQNKFFLAASTQRERAGEREAELIQTEWGEFFPVYSSPFAYNDSVASEYYPMKKEEVLARGWKWRDAEAKNAVPQTYIIPDDIRDAHDEIFKEVLQCEQCGKNFKLIEQELKIYRESGIAVPRKCWLCRDLDRRSLKNPRTLHERTCSKCHAEIATTYASDRPEPVYCEKCYLETVA